MLLVDTELRPSPIHGTGVFSRQFIPAGAVVWTFAPGFDLEIDPPEVERLAPPARDQFLKYSYLDVFTGKYVLCFDDGRFFNHSDAPNVMDGATPETAQSSVAIRDILPGEELTCDYRTFDALSRDGLEDLDGAALLAEREAGDAPRREVSAG
jgi:uncharacterized protein